MNQLSQIFMYEGRQVRTVMKDGEPWFVLKDLCDVLEISHAPALRQRLNDDVVSNYPIPDAIGRKQDTLIINEDGMYDVILESRKSEARNFRKWVTGDVLPTIRKHGAYMTSETIEKTLTDPDFIIRLATELKTERLEKQALQLKIESDRLKVIFAESLEVSKDLIGVGDLAKLLKQNGFEIGEVRLFRWLRDNGYLIKSGSEYNQPTQRSMELKVMEIKTGSRMGSDGVSHITRTPKITTKGQLYFINKFKSLQQAN